MNFLRRLLSVVLAWTAVIGAILGFLLWAAVCLAIPVLLAIYLYNHL